MVAKVKVLIADDHEIMRKGLSLIFEDSKEFELVGEAVDGLDCCEKVERLRPDVVLMDLRMPRRDGIEATKKIKEAYPEVKVIALTAVEDGNEIFNALEAGVDGYILKAVSGKDLQEAIRTVLQGETYLHPDVAKKVLGQRRREPVAGEPQRSGLTDREVLVLQLMAAGCRNREIAERLFVSEETVKSHVSHILAKLNQPDRIHAVLYALRHNIVSLDPEEAPDSV